MTKTIEYYYSLNSPWTYLGGVRLEETARRHGATIHHIFTRRDTGAV